MIKKLTYMVSQVLIRVFGNIQFFKAPFFCLLWGDANYKVDGPEVRTITELLLHGDIVLRKYDRYISGLFIPGFWTHVGIVTDDGKKIVHAMHDGVVEEDILTYLRTDYVKVVRLKDRSTCNQAVDTAISLKGREYDFIFDTTDDSRLYCSELVKYCYPGVFDDVGKGAIPPDDLLKAGLEVVHDSFEYRKKEG